MHLLFSVKLEKVFAVNVCTKKLSCRAISFFFFAVNVCTTKIVKSCNLIFFAANACTKELSNRVIFFAVNACAKKKSSSHVIFFVVMRVMGLHDLLQKKLHDVTIFWLHAFTARIRYTYYNIHIFNVCVGVGGVNRAWLDPPLPPKRLN